MSDSHPPVALVICSPILHMDEYAAALAKSLSALRSAGVRFTHLVVGPERNRQSAAETFRETESLFLAESPSTRGVFDAVRQGYDYALEHLKPTHLAYINADDLLEPGFAKAVAACRTDEAQLITGGVNWIGDKGEFFGRIPEWPWTFGSSSLFEIGVPPLTQQGTIFSADVWRKCGGFNPRYKLIADSVMWHGLLKSRSVRRVHISEVVASYRIRSGQLSGDRGAVQAECDQWRGTLSNGILDKAGRRVAKVLMRAHNAPVYLRRLLGGRRMRAGSAMKEGGF